ncbi:Mechanosensitive ion channel-domain-containing protein [Microdochium trichocladiopsis]|uniref:Mechanosensitive ion channel protein n=1 Tax=Microdochium trichocladiopsis TaxID=1682393 RepID=A0A9P9BS50_9PEZI|nr:Mechanosensitive ion channel-domain-containing protein [Microdochium trichocladiopsis]KAH7033388.1 Mechanosensitive ion channel-domain-containing protein [Microdochium trichocladiopsis]
MSTPEQTEEKGGGSPTLTHAATVSESDLEKFPPHNERHNHLLQIPTHPDRFPANSFLSPNRDHTREQATRLNDDLMLLQAERAVSEQEGSELRRSVSRVRSGQPEEDVFNQPAAPTAVAIPVEADNRAHKIVDGVKGLPRFVRYFFYCLPVAGILLVPVLLGYFQDDDKQTVIGGPGGVPLLWFGIWLEVVWLSLWAARIFTSILPFVLKGFALAFGAGSSNQWKDMGRQIELHFALFLWMLAVLISFWPTFNNHKVPASEEESPGNPFPEVEWMNTVNKVIISIFVLSVMNFVEKIIIQWIAMSFHTRTYMTRIEENKQSIAYLVHLYEHSKDRLVSEASVMHTDGATASGAWTPMAAIQNNARETAAIVGDAAKRMAGDFTGRKVKLSNHPRKVVTELLRSTQSAQVLARRLFRTYAPDEEALLRPHDLRPAFPSDEDAEAAFSIFDRDLNGDVSMEELEAFCDEVHREKKAIAASLKDLDSVVRKLDRVFFVIIFIIAVIVLISIVSASAAAALASLGTAVLGLAWVLQATAQEFLQSIIFVFVKHPFDVGDRITVYGNTGALGRGDDYYITEISLLYTEFKKMEGHIVQAPNSLLNTLFILNHRRSGALADVFELTMKYGTPSSVIKELEARMTEFVLDNKRDYTSKIITEVRNFEDALRMRVNFICFHKTSYQNELLRLTRHNKFAIELMNQMVDLGIEQPRQQIQISGRDYPVYQSNIQPPTYEEQQQNNTVDPSMLAATRRRAGSTTASDTGDMYQDVYVARRQSTARYQHMPPRITEESPTPNASALHLDRMSSRGTQQSHGNASNTSNFFRRRDTVRQSHERDQNSMV